MGRDVLKMNLEKLKDKFPSAKIEFRIGATNKEKTKGIVLAYVTNRAIQERLDDVCGVGNWRNEFKQWREKSQLCGISIKIGEEWVTKWDGAEDTKTEPIKGGLSASMKRAAAQWGIGRYLYDIPNEWADIIQSGNSYKFKQRPKLSAEFLPDNDTGKDGLADIATDDEIQLLDKSEERTKKISNFQHEKLLSILSQNDISEDKVKKWAKVKTLQDLTKEQYDVLLSIYEQQGYNTAVTVKLSDNDKKGLDRLNGMVQNDIK